MKKQTGYFKDVKPLPGYRLDVDMETGTRVILDFKSALETMRFGVLENLELFNTAYTNGKDILFRHERFGTVSITASDFMDIVLIDRTADWNEVGYYK